MGVYIKDFETPKNCAECKFSDVFTYPPGYDDEWICELTYIHMNYEDAQMRHSNCPLVSVPPHGRLIDADALEYSLGIEDRDIYAYHVINDAPTVIETGGCGG